MSLFNKALYIVKSSTNLYVYGLLLSQEPNILNKARFIQFSRIRIFVEDNDIASMAKKIKMENNMILTVQRKSFQS